MKEAVQQNKPLRLASRRWNGNTLQTLALTALVALCVQHQSLAGKDLNSQNEKLTDSGIARR